MSKLKSQKRKYRVLMGLEVEVKVEAQSEPEAIEAALEALSNLKMVEENYTLVGYRTELDEEVVKDDDYYKKCYERVVELFNSPEVMDNIRVSEVKQYIDNQLAGEYTTFDIDLAMQKYQPTLEALEGQQKYKDSIERAQEIITELNTEVPEGVELTPRQKQCFEDVVIALINISQVAPPERAQELVEQALAKKYSKEEILEAVKLGRKNWIGKEG